jgi:hypothetical protein
LVGVCLVRVVRFVVVVVVRVPGVLGHVDVVEVVERTHDNKPASDAQNQQSDSRKEGDVEDGAISGGALNNANGERQHHQNHTRASGERQAQREGTISGDGHNLLLIGEIGYKLP